MRAFIAIDLPEPLHAALAEAQQAFRNACRDARWTRPEGIHLTLKFLGEISDAQTKQVVEALAQIGQFEPFSVEVKGFGFFPQAQRPRVFWAGRRGAAGAGGTCRAGREPHGENRVCARGPRLLAAPDPGALSSAAPAAGAGGGGRRTGHYFAGEFEASEFFLFESKLSPQGAQYRKVMRFPLK